MKKIIVERGANEKRTIIWIHFGGSFGTDFFSIEL